tara:strand:+ start:387 stop:647 length:261 start_codon:yes stop_codon:yes gene_type:complete
MGATVMKAIPGNQGESTDQKGMRLVSKMAQEKLTGAVQPSTTQIMDEGKESKKKKKKDKQTILTSTAGVTDEAEISNRSLMGGGSY